MNERVFDLVREAVNVAREESIRSVALLRSALYRRHPDAKADVDEALRFWAQRETGSTTSP